MEASYYDDNGWYSANAMDNQKYRDWLWSLPDHGQGYVSKEQARVAAAQAAAFAGKNNSGFWSNLWSSLTSGAHSAYDAWSDIVDKYGANIDVGLTDWLKSAGDYLTSARGQSSVVSGSSGSSGSGDLSALLPATYEGAPYAQMYGMDTVTAYEEALANSAVQRRVKDLQAAGLNPVLAASDGATGVSGASVYAPDSPLPTSAKSQSGAITAFGNVVAGIFELVGKKKLASGVKSIAKGLDGLF